MWLKCISTYFSSNEPPPLLGSWSPRVLLVIFGRLTECLGSDRPIRMIKPNNTLLGPDKTNQLSSKTSPLPFSIPKLNLGYSANVRFVFFLVLACSNAIDWMRVSKPRALFSFTGSSFLDGSLWNESFVGQTARRFALISPFSAWPTLSRSKHI